MHQGTHNIQHIMTDLVRADETLWEGLCGAHNHTIYVSYNHTKDSHNPVTDQPTMLGGIMWCICACSLEVAFASYSHICAIVEGDKWSSNSRRHHVVYTVTQSILCQTQSYSIHVHILEKITIQQWKASCGAYNHTNCTMHRPIIQRPIIRYVTDHHTVPGTIMWCVQSQNQ